MRRGGWGVCWFAGVGPAPVHLIVDAPPHESLPWWVLPVVFTAAAAGAALLGIGAVARRRRRLNAGDAAFRRLVIKMRIPTASAALVQRLAAAHPGVTPAAILMSNDALRAAAGAFAKGRASKRELRLLEELLRARGVTSAPIDAAGGSRLAKSA